MAKEQAIEVVPLSIDEACRIWEVLRESGAVTGSEISERLGHEFRFDQTTRFINEYRFGGMLGMGGKFWRSNGKWYVNCYPENETPERKAIIEKANKALAELKAKIESEEIQ